MYCSGLSKKYLNVFVYYCYFIKLRSRNVTTCLKKTTKFRFKWSSEAMQLAISDIQQSKLGKKKSAGYYGVPKTNYFQFQLGCFWLMKNSSL